MLPQYELNPPCNLAKKLYMFAGSIKKNYISNQYMLLLTARKVNSLETNYMQCSVWLSAVWRSLLHSLSQLLQFSQASSGGCHRTNVVVPRKFLLLRRLDLLVYRWCTTGVLRQVSTWVMCNWPSLSLQCGTTSTRLIWEAHAHASAKL